MELTIGAIFAKIRRQLAIAGRLLPVEIFRADS